MVCATSLHLMLAQLMTGEREALCPLGLRESWRVLPPASLALLALMSLPLQVSQGSTLSPLFGIKSLISILSFQILFIFKSIYNRTFPLLYLMIWLICCPLVGEEALNPSRTIPFSIGLSLFIIFLSYFGISAVITLAVPYCLQVRLWPPVVPLLDFDILRHSEYSLRYDHNHN